ncbi:MAG: glycosyltransferase [Deltaproteobacteria bacterium]|nr:glycosyltransferase [Deltaproteobacteria bacterium]
MGKYLVDSHLLSNHFVIEVLPLRSSRSTKDLGRFRFGKVMEFVVAGARLTTACMFRRPAFVYFTITPNGMAFYRDLLYVAIMKCFGVMRVYHLHGKGIRSMAQGNFTRCLFRWTFSRAKVILLSPLLYEDISHLVNRSNCCFLPNGIPDVSKGYTYLKNTDTVGIPRILFFSNMMRSKGILVLLEALNALNLAGVSFRSAFAGEWESKSTEDAFYKTIRENGLKEVVEYVGARYSREKEELFSASDIFSFPTMNDSFPVVILEAMRHGLPVIATDEGAIPDIVEEGTTGFLVPKGDHKMLTERLNRLIHDTELRSRMGEAGRARFLNHFTIETFERNALSVFTMLLAEKLSDACSKPNLEDQGRV